MPGIVAADEGGSKRAFGRRLIPKKLQSYRSLVLFIRNVTFMTTDPPALATFWAEALGLTERRDVEDDTILASDKWSSPRLTFQKMADGRAHPSHLHLDLTADDRVREVNRLRELGAHEQRSVTVEDDWTWTVMTDPDG